MLYTINGFAQNQTREEVLELRRHAILESFNNAASNGGGMRANELIVYPNKTAVELVEELLGNGFTYGDNVNNAVLVNPGLPNANGFFDSNGSNIGMEDGIIFASGNAETAEGPNSGGSSGGGSTGPGDADLNAIPGVNGTNDASGIEFDFIPESDTIKFQYVFGSEEYCQFIDSYNDVFAFFLTSNEADGFNYVNENIALIPETNLAVTINNLNHGSIGDNIDPNVCDYCQYYVDNQPGGGGFGGGGAGLTVEYDGFTTVLTAWAVVTPCKEYHIKIVIADDVDNSLDSGVFLKSNSFSAASVDVVEEYSNENISGSVEGCNDVTLNFNVDPRGLDTEVDFEIITGAGFATYGVDYTTIPPLPNFPLGTIVIPAGESTQTLQIITIDDGIPEPPEHFKLEYTHDLGCAGTTTNAIRFDIEDHLDVAITPFGNLNIQCGDSTSLWVDVADGYPDYSYSWTNGAGDVDSIRVWPAVDTEYTVSVNDECGFNSDHTFSVLVVQPVAQITGEQIICAGDSITLFATGGSSYLWSDNSTADTLVVAPQVTTVYTVTVTTDLGCSADAQVTVPVNPLPTVNLSDFPPVCMDNNAFVLTQGSPANGIYWGTGVAAVGDDYVFDATGFNAGDLVDIIYVYQDGNNCQNSDTTTIEVVALPEVFFNPADNRFCIDEGLISLSAGTPAGGYYYGPGVDMSTGLFDPDSTTTGVGQYSLNYSFTDGNGCVNTKDTMVEVLDLPVVQFNTIPSPCLEGGLFLLTQGNPLGGVYSGPGVNSGTGEFDPIAAGGVGTYTLTYTYTDGDNCTNVNTQDISCIART